MSPDIKASVFEGADSARNQAAWDLCSNAGSGIQIFNRPKCRGSVLQLAANLFALGCFLFLAFAILSSFRPGPTTYAAAATSENAAPYQYSATKGER